MPKITEAQKKIIIKTLVIIGVFFLIWLFVYLPLKSKVRAIQTELTTVENEIKEIRRISKTGVITGQTLKFFQERFKELVNKFPKQEEEALGALSKFAKELKIKLISINPSPKEILRDQANKVVSVEGRACQRVFVLMRMECDYSKLVEYIQKLKRDLPAFVSIEKVYISKIRPAGKNKLKVRLEFNIYLLS